MTWFNTMILLIIGIELALIYVRIGNPANKS